MDVPQLVEERSAQLGVPDICPLWDALPFGVAGTQVVGKGVAGFAVGLPRFEVVDVECGVLNEVLLHLTLLFLGQRRLEALQYVRALFCSF